MKESRWDRLTRQLQAWAEIAGRKRLARQGRKLPLSTLLQEDAARQLKIPFPEISERNA